MHLYRPAAFIGGRYYAHKDSPSSPARSNHDVHAVTGWQLPGGMHKNREPRPAPISRVARPLRDAHREGFWQRQRPVTRLITLASNEAPRVMLCGVCASRGLLSATALH